MPRPVPAARFDLVCLPYSGAPASVYRTWAEIMAPLAQVHAVQLPGRGARWSEPPARSMTELVDSLRVATVTDLRRPVVLFGHSFGALLAFELAHGLRAHADRPPTLLAVSGRTSPQARQPMPPDPDSPRAVLVEHLRELGGTPETILADPELLALVLPPLRADYRLLRAWRYRPEPPLDVALLAYIGDDDGSASLEQVVGWEQQTRADFDLITLPGGHFYGGDGLLEPAHDLRRRLARLA